MKASLTVLVAIGLANPNCAALAEEQVGSRGFSVAPAARPISAAIGNRPNTTASTESIQTSLRPAGMPPSAIEPRSALPPNAMPSKAQQLQVLVLRIRQMKETGDQLNEELSRLQQSIPMPPDATASEETKKHYEQSVAPLKGKIAAVESKLQKCAEQIAAHEADVRALHERAIRSTASNTSYNP